MHPDNTAMPARKRCHRRQQGLSLIELLIATVLGLIIVTALTQLFADVSRTNREMAKTNSQIESARFAMQFLRKDLSHAGFWGSFVPQFDDQTYAEAPDDAPPFAPDPCRPFTSWPSPLTDTPLARALIGLPVQAYSESPSSNCNSVITDKLADTHVLVVRHAETCAVGATNCGADITGRLYLQVSNCASEIEADNNYVLDTSGHVLTERGCAPATLAPKRRFIQHIYYIRTWANEAGDGIPTLVRSEFDLVGGALSQQPPVALVPGIERFQVQLGIDSVSGSGAAVDYTDKFDWQPPEDRVLATNRGDGVPDTFVSCPAAGCPYEQLTNAVAIKLYLLARADEESPGYTDTKSYNLGGLVIPAFNDSFKRHVFSATMRINNVAGRRETP